MLDPAGLMFNPVAYGPGARSANNSLLQLRSADASLRAEGNRLDAEAGGSAVVQYAYSRGEDGKSYVSGVTVSRTQRTTPSNDREIPFQPLSKQDQSFAALNRSAVTVTLSPLAQELLDRADAAAKPDSLVTAQSTADALALRELQNADSTVRNHEGLHFRAAGGVAQGLPSYEYLEGPDGKLYAVAGEVQVKTSTTTDPEKAARDAASLAASATAPADASTQDLFAAREAYGNVADLFGTAIKPSGDNPNRPATPEPVNLLV